MRHICRYHSPFTTI